MRTSAPSEAETSYARHLADVVAVFVRSNDSYPLLDAYTTGTWAAGGCGLLADALLKVAGRGQMLGIEAKNGIIQHVGIELDGLVIDAVNTYTSRGRWRAAFERRERFSDCTAVEMAEWWDAKLWETASDACAVAIEAMLASETIRES